jgi:hypothetical protein
MRFNLLKYNTIFCGKRAYPMGSALLTFPITTPPDGFPIKGNYFTLCVYFCVLYLIDKAVLKLRWLYR